MLACNLVVNYFLHYANITIQVIELPTFLRSKICKIYHYQDNGTVNNIFVTILYANKNSVINLILVMD